MLFAAVDESTSGAKRTRDSYPSMSAFFGGKDGVIGGRFCGLAEDFGCRASPW
jgi:hypothetical protein